MNAPIRNAAKRRQKQEARGPGPRGKQSWPVTPTWKAEIRRRLIARSWSQAELARKIEASPGAIVLIFRPETSHSRLVPAIHKALGLNPPSITVAVEEAA